MEQVRDLAHEMAFVGVELAPFSFLHQSLRDRCHRLVHQPGAVNKDLQNSGRHANRCMSNMHKEDACMKAAIKVMFIVSPLGAVGRMGRLLPRRAALALTATLPVYRR